MRKTLLLIGFLGMTLMAHSQVIFAVQSPSSIAGNYGFTWAPPSGGWGTPDFLIPGTYVEDTLMFVDDSSAGTNPQGNPVSAEGCNPLVNDLTGKIAVIYRNTCEFGTKAMNAQNAGAVACIIINRDNRTCCGREQCTKKRSRRPSCYNNCRSFNRRRSCCRKKE